MNERELLEIQAVRLALRRRIVSVGESMRRPYRVAPCAVAGGEIRGLRYADALLARMLGETVGSDDE